MQKAFAEYTRANGANSIRIRIGINAGETILTEGRLFGTAVHTTFRICARAQPGQILVSDVIHQLVAGKDFTFVDHGRIALKGLAERMRLYEVLWKREPA
jgi:class 3 adenylate cyclase